MNLLGLDIGSKRIGIAFAETGTRVAVPVRVVRRSTLEKEAGQIQALVREYEVERLIVGLPLRELGGEGPQAARTRAYMQRLAQLLPTPYEFADERYSTLEAIAAQARAGRTEREGRMTVDAAAAAVLLQAYLDSHTLAGETGP